MKLTTPVAMLLGASTAAAAQDATMIYRLGHDTVAIEQITRTSTHLIGESVLRQGTAITRSQYDVTLAGGKPTMLVFRRRQADGTPIPNNPVEWRLTFGADSTRRDIVWKDSTQSQTFAVKGAFINIPVYSYGLFELVRGRDSIPAVGLAGNAVGNKQVGQWGTEYRASQDIGRVKMDMAKTPSHVEDFTITVRATGPNRGAFDFAWGDSVATAVFTIRP